jgi:hypothetical protein
MNQYRCETCKRYIPESGEGIGWCNRDNKQPVWITTQEKKWVGRVGCASHSNQKSELDNTVDRVIAFTKGYTAGTKSGGEKVINLFEAFEHWANGDANLKHDVFGEKMTHIIQDIREHPDWVIRRGIKDGWLKEPHNGGKFIFPLPKSEIV